MAQGLGTPTSVIARDGTSLRCASAMIPRVSHLAGASRLDREGSPLNLRCYAFNSERSWEAICVDFDIAVFESSLVEVQSSLNTGIELYLEEVADANAEDRRYLLSRRSPWYVRANLRFRVWADGLFAGAGGFRRFTLRPRLPVLR